MSRDKGLIDILLATSTETTPAIMLNAGARPDMTVTPNNHDAGMDDLRPAFHQWFRLLSP